MPKNRYVATVHLLGYVLARRKKDIAVSDIERERTSTIFHEGARRWGWGWHHANEKAVQVLEAFGLKPETHKLLGGMIAQELCVSFDEGKNGRHKASA